MKKIKNINHPASRPIKKKCILIMLFIIMANCMYAETVSEQKANEVAVNFLSSTTGRSGLKAVLNYKQVEVDGSIDFYVFNFLSFKSFVIVTGDNNLEPVIAYSTESGFDINAARKTGVNDWINDVQKQIREALKSNVKSDARIAGLWAAYLSGNPIMKPQSTAVTPLLTTTWDQRWNTGGTASYNSLCPFNATDNMRCVTGCVATAMAQIMKYWNQPLIGTGSHSYTCVNSSSGYNYGLQSVDFWATTYNWGAMPNSLTSTSTNDVDILMYQCGVAVNMDYGDGIGSESAGSSAYVIGGANTAQAAYVNYFGYNNTIQGLWATNYTSSAWIILLKNELDAKRPVQYLGAGPSGGHTWVCDGYDANNLFHMNWGWGGSSNGYFSVSNLNPGSFVFNSGLGALIGITPNNLSGCSTNWNLSGTLNSNYSWQASDYITSNITLPGYVNCAYSASNEIILTTGFNAYVNSTFSATIHPCLSARVGNNSDEATVKNGDNNLSVYPNPASDFITLKINNADSKTVLKIYNSTMQLIKTLNFEDGIENKISTADLSPGIYFVIAKTTTDNYNQKFIIVR